VILFYIIAFVSLLAGLVLTDRRYYAHRESPHHTYSRGLGLIGITLGMGISSIFLAFA
jgi:hypothetical protein